MKKLIGITTMLLLAASFATAADIAFVDGYQAALEKAQALNKYLIVTFHTDW